MTILYEGTRNKLDYVCTKLRNVIDDFYMEGEQNDRFTPNIDATMALENELDIAEEIAALGYCCKSDWKIVIKYASLADEFRMMKCLA